MKMQLFLEELEKYGTLSFTIKEACESLGKDKKYVSRMIHVFKKKGAIISPIKGFYIIIPLEHRLLGSLPPEELVVLSMRHLQIPYYAGLLTAAAYHGATHQRLRVFQVVTSNRISKEWIFGDVWISFIHKKDVSHVVVKNKKFENGYLPVSTPEETAKDVMTYYRQCGGLNHQATVLAELAGAINTRELVSLAKRSGKLFWVQRMGYILENIDTFYKKERDKVVYALEKFLSTQKLRYVPLAPEIPTKDKPRNKKWKIIENTTVESDV
ncbi:MAG: type IV toxin-antitoxin system AbiEi family antitoxin [Bacteroidota bacterium]